MSGSPLAPLQSSPRKRTSSFSTPKPTKPRMSSLRRTSSYITLPDLVEPPQPSLRITIPSASSDASFTVRQAQRKRRAAHYTRAAPQFTVGPAPTAPLPPTPKHMAAHFPRASSPLSPCRKLLPPRASFPRSRQEPDLYKVAITARMKCSPEGQKILSMGPRLAVSILTATRDLEQIVASCTDNDVQMADGTVSNSWVVVPGEETRDWEMVDC
ncbi:hypothetical protein HWV62_2298 [Athelia sp. TMB]|nr:hypothetical protein HWV62_6138 [Athelia sp. TMB]KAF7985712.1 hypothetical protein HWV62_2298 [Athelia sp. TMB]